MITTRLRVLLEYKKSIIVSILKPLFGTVDSHYKSSEVPLLYVMFQHWRQRLSSKSKKIGQILNLKRNKTFKCFFFKQVDCRKGYLNTNFTFVYNSFLLVNSKNNLHFFIFSMKLPSHLIISFVIDNFLFTITREPCNLIRTWRLSYTRRWGLVSKVVILQ